MPEPIQITSKSGLNYTVANAVFCPEPALSERRAIHESGAWRWNPGRLIKAWWGDPGRIGMAHWEPADFCGDPAASYALRQKMRAEGWAYTASISSSGRVYTQFYRYGNGGAMEFGNGDSTDECVSFALAALRALGVEFELVEGWDK